MTTTLAKWQFFSRRSTQGIVSAGNRFGHVALALFSLAPLSMVPAWGASPAATSVGHSDYEIFPLPFDPAVFSVDQLVVLKDNDTAVLSYSKLSTFDIIAYDILKSTAIHFDAFKYNDFVRLEKSPREPNAYSQLPVVNWHPQIIRIGDTKITIFNYVTPHYPLMVSFGCYRMEGPAESYVRIEKESEVSEKVLLYVFPHPIRPVPTTNRCDDGFYSPPHDTIRIINPNLIAASNSDGSAYLAGQSYVSMPFVIKIGPLTDFSKNIGPLYVLDKSVIDRINSTIDVSATTTPAETASKIEERLLDVTVRGSK